MTLAGDVLAGGALAGGALAGGALVSSAPTKQELHQPSYTAPTKLHYTSFFVGALETSAPPKETSAPPKETSAPSKETSAPSTTPHLSKIKIKQTITF